MRTVLHGDIVTLARHLITRSEDTWVAIINEALDKAEYAENHRQNTGRSHPKLGTGSLAAACSGWKKADEPFFDDAQYRRAWMTILNEIDLRDQINREIEERW